MAKLARAAIVPYDETGSSTLDSEAIAFDFNPDTLRLELTANTESVEQEGRQVTQYTGTSQAKLSLTAVFDTTRPPTADSGGGGLSLDLSISVDISIGASGGNAEEHDVRKKTSRLANLLRPDLASSGGMPARRVQFRWGAIVFDGVITSFSETLDYFAPEGVPLRSTVTLAIKEQNLTYQVDPVDRSALRLSGGFGFELGLGVGLELGLDLGLGLDLELDLGLGVDLGFSASAGIDLSADAAVDLFGGAAVDSAVGGDVDLSRSAGGRSSGASKGGAGRATPTAWAPGGPTAGSSAAALASAVNQARASGADQQRAAPHQGSFVATSLGGGAQGGGASSTGAEATSGPGGAGAVAAAVLTAAPPVRGSPPRVTARRGPPPAEGVFSRSRASTLHPSVSQVGRPSWETLPPAESTSKDHTTSCECSRCRSRA